MVNSNPVAVEPEAVGEVGEAGVEAEAEARDKRWDLNARRSLCHIGYFSQDCKDDSKCGIKDVSSEIS